MKRKLIKKALKFLPLGFLVTIPKQLQKVTFGKGQSSHKEQKQKKIMTKFTMAGAILFGVTALLKKFNSLSQTQKTLIIAALAAVLLAWLFGFGPITIVRKVAWWAACYCFDCVKDLWNEFMSLFGFLHG